MKNLISLVAILLIGCDTHIACNVALGEVEMYEKCIDNPNCMLRPKDINSHKYHTIQISEKCTPSMVAKWYKTK